MKSEVKNENGNIAVMLDEEIKRLVEQEEWEVIQALHDMVDAGMRARVRLKEGRGDE